MAVWRFFKPSRSLLGGIETSPGVGMGGRAALSVSALTRKTICQQLIVVREGPGRYHERQRRLELLRLESGRYTSELHGTLKLRKRLSLEILD